MDGPRSLVDGCGFKIFLDHVHRQSRVEQVHMGGDFGGDFFAFP